MTKMDVLSVLLLLVAHCVVLVISESGPTAAAEPEMWTKDGSLWFTVDPEKQIGFQIGSDGGATYDVVSLAKAATDASEEAEKLKTQMTRVLQRLDDLEDENKFMKKMNNALHRSMGQHDWSSHSLDNTKVDTFRMLGAAGVNEVLQVSIEDSGCESGIGLSYVISATTGVDGAFKPTVLSLGNANPDLAARFQFVFEGVSATHYKLGLKIMGWNAPCNGETDQPHQTKYTIQSSSSEFVAADGSEAVDPSAFTIIPTIGLNEVAASVGLGVSGGAGAGGSVLDRLTNLEDDFVSKVNTAINRFEMTHGWTSHSTDPAKVDTDFYIGSTEVSDILHVSLSDSGCNSGFAASFEIQTIWGLERANAKVYVTTIGTANDGLANKFKFYWKASAQHEFHLAMKITGWNGPCGATENAAHTTKLVVESSPGKFTSGPAPNDYDISDYIVTEGMILDTVVSSSKTSLDTLTNTVTTAVNDRISALEQTLGTTDSASTSLIERVNQLEDTDTFADKVDDALHRDVKVFRWVTHTAAEESGEFVIGKAHVEQVLHIDVTDTGCNSGVGVAYTLTSRWGVDISEAFAPEMYTFGAAHTNMESRITWVYKPLNRNEFVLGLKIAGWASCGPQTTGHTHTTTVTVSASDGRFDSAYEATIDDTYLVTEPMVFEYLVPGEFVPKEKWVPVTLADIHIDAVNTNVDITTGAGGVIQSYAVTPLDGGCGAGIGSAETMYIKGRWSKVRFTQYFMGVTACYSIWGDLTRVIGNVQDKTVTIHVNGVDRTDELYKGVDLDPHLIPFDKNIDPLYDTVGERFADTKSGNTECHNDGHFWSITGNTRRATVELRRQSSGSGWSVEYPESSGISTGVTCTQISTNKWRYENIQVLLD